MLVKNNVPTRYTVRHRHQQNTYNKKFPSKSSPIRRQTESLRVAIVDDEGLARRAIRRVLENCTNIEYIYECSDGVEAVKILKQVQPDLIFLDIEMPHLNGFQVVEQLKPHHIPFIVFVTAHQEYALDAFKVHAVDYLVKPISEEKIWEVLQRTLNQLQTSKLKDIDTRLDSILHLIDTQTNGSHQQNSSERIAIKNNGRIYFVETTTIDWIEANGNYVTLHTGKISHLLRIKMNQLMDQLDPRIFYRIHRSTIVNIRSIKELHPYFNGSYMILLKDDVRIYSSRGYRDRINQIIHQIS